MDVACVPAWTLAGCVRGLRCLHLCLVLDPLGCGLSMQPAFPAVHVPGPHFCSKYSSALPPAHSSAEADIFSSWGAACARALHPPCTDLTGLRTGAPGAQITSCPFWRHPWLPPATSRLPPRGCAGLWRWGQKSEGAACGGGRRMGGRPRQRPRGGTQEAAFERRCGEQPGPGLVGCTAQPAQVPWRISWPFHR